MLAFSGFGNFCIVARQRTLMLPFAMVALALPTVTPARGDDRELAAARRR